MDVECQMVFLHLQKEITQLYKNMINITYFHFIPYSNNIKTMQINIQQHPDKIIEQKKIMNQKSSTNAKKKGPPRNPVFRF